MTEPVDTDALRQLSAIQWSRLMDWASDAEQGLSAAADEVDRLRLSDSNATQQRDQLANALRRSDNENDRLRAAIENAPHGRYCALTFRPKPKHTANRCTCWKADAL